MQVGGQDAVIGAGAFALFRLKDHGAGAIAEQHAGRPVFPIQDAREGLRPDHQGRLGLTEPDEVVGHRQREDEAGTDRLKVEGDAVGNAKLGLHPGRGRRERVVRRRGRQDDQIDLILRYPGVLQRLARGGQRQIRRLLGWGRQMAGPDASALRYPIIRRIDPLGEVLIGYNVLRQVRSAACDPGTSNHLYGRCLWVWEG